MMSRAGVRRSGGTPRDPEQVLDQYDGCRPTVLRERISCRRARSIVRGLPLLCGEIVTFLTRLRFLPRTRYTTHTAEESGMRAMIAGAVVALVAVGSVFGPIGGAAFAQTDSTIDQVIVDDQGLSNIWHTQDNGPSNDGPPDDFKQTCKCMAGLADSLADCC